MDPIVDRLLESNEPAIRYKVMLNVLGMDPESGAMKKARDQIRDCDRIQMLLAHRDDQGRITPVHHVYRKWTGAHWVLATLADLNYPAGDPEIKPICNQVLDFWLHPESIREWICDRPSQSYGAKGVPIIDGRARRCASQQGNALYSVLSLGHADDRCDQLADLLMRWQWPDGGWNCDRKAAAHKSSFWESLIPLRALALYGHLTGKRKVKQSVKRAAELFLQRRLFKRLRDGQVMNPDFLDFHYPCYWRYDILFALKVMSEAGMIRDERCADALNLLESKRLDDGGWPAEKRFYRVTKVGAGSGCDWVGWGGVDKLHLNEWVTADALAVLRAAGRLDS